MTSGLRFLRGVPAGAHPSPQRKGGFPQTGRNTRRIAIKVRGQSRQAGANAAAMTRPVKAGQAASHYLCLKCLNMPD